MKRFLNRLVCFVCILLFVITVGIFLPATPREKKSLLFSKIAKDSLLKVTKSPRIIFIGGSNLSFGLNSQMIKDSLHYFPINTSIQASLGIVYMMDDVWKYLKKNDVVILVPEYANFYGNFAYGSEELLRIELDIYPIRNISLREKQWLNIAKFIPKYAFSKFIPSEYINIKENDIYGIHSFNQYGDVDAHWYKKSVKYEPITKFHGALNDAVFNSIETFNNKLKSRGILFYVSYPCFQKTSYNHCAKQINEIEKKLKQSQINILGSPDKYCFDDSLTFNKPYHLTKSGLDRRTQFLIEDLKVAMK